MSYRSIFLHLDDGDAWERTIDVGASVAKSFGAELAGCYLVPRATVTPFTSALLPDVTTFAAAGLPEVNPEAFRFIGAPAGLPAPVLDKLYQASVAALKTPDVISALDKMGAKPAPMDPKSFATYIRAEQRKYEVIVKQSGATVD